MSVLYQEVKPVNPNGQQEFGSFSIYDKKRFLIADEGGYGKTIQAIDAKRLIEIGNNERIKALVICPNSAREYWTAQVTTNYPDQTALVLDRYSPEALQQASDADFVIVNHNVFGNKRTRSILIEGLGQIGFGYIIVDESHNTKNPSAFRSKHIRKLTDGIEYLALLSATPVPDKLQDIYALISMMEPETYPTALSVMKVYQRNPLVLGSVLNQRMLRRGEEEIPEVTPWVVNLGEDHMRVYTEVLEYGDISPTEKLDQLRKASLDPSLVDPELISDPELRARLKDLDSSKYRELDKLLSDVVQAGEKAVVFTSRFKEGVTRKLEQRYEQYGALRIDGDVKAGYMGKRSRREEVRQLFQTSPDHKVLITNPETMGEGVSLIGASYVIFLDLPYTPATFYQAIKRVDRRGQERDVTVVNMITNYPFHRKGSIDVGVRELIEEKKRLIDFVMRGGKVKLEEGKLVSDTPTSAQRPIDERLYSSRQQLRRILTRMVGRSSSDNSHFLDRHDGRMAQEFAEVYAEGWEYSYSAKTAQVYEKIIEGLIASGEPLGRMLDVASGPAVLSRVLGRPVVNLDINSAHFEKAKELCAHPDNEFYKGFMHELFFDDVSFDLVLCSLGLHFAELERKDKEKGIVRERERAIREANRALRRNGYYIITLPDYLEVDELKFYEGLEMMGFEVVRELSGKVFATEPEDSRFRVYAVTARKVNRPSSEIDKEYFEFKTDKQIMESRERQGRLNNVIPPQPRLELCREFAFYDPRQGLETVESRLDKYTNTRKSKDVLSEARRSLQELDVLTMDDKEYFVVIESRRLLTIYVPRERIETMLKELELNHRGESRKRLQETDLALFRDLRRLHLI